MDFYFKVRFDHDFESIVPGFLLKSLNGIFLFGTNSFIASNGHCHLRAEAGNIYLFKFTVPMLLNRGNYLISCGISSGNPLGELLPLDRRYDSVMITVEHKIPFWGVIDLNATFESVSIQ
jgi:lipopolysaccharide transport system ATP-binding protein